MGAVTRDANRMLVMEWVAHTFYDEHECVWADPLRATRRVEPQP
jgi:hypothetical protein